MSDPRYKPPTEDEKISSHASLDLAIKRWQTVGDFFAFILHIGTVIGPIILIIYLFSPPLRNVVNQYSFLFIALAIVLVGFWIFGSFRLGQLHLKKRRTKHNPEDDWQIPT